MVKFHHIILQLTAVFLRQSDTFSGNIYFAGDGTMKHIIKQNQTLQDGSPLDVFHELEGTSRSLDFFHRVGGQFVHELAQDDSILKDVLESSGGKLFPQHCGDPVENLLLELLIATLKIGAFVNIREYNAFSRLLRQN